jgi:hypothetical protein
MLPETGVYQGVREICIGKSVIPHSFSSFASCVYAVVGHVHIEVDDSQLTMRIRAIPIGSKA